MAGVDATLGLCNALVKVAATSPSTRTHRTLQKTNECSCTLICGCSTNDEIATSTSASNVVKIWDLNTLQVTQVIPDLGGNVIWSNTSSKLLVSTGMSISSVDTSTGIVNWTIEGIAAKNAWSLDDSYIIGITNTDSLRYQPTIWNASDGSIHTTLIGDEFTFAFDWSIDSTLLAASTIAGTVQVFDVSTGILLHEVAASTSSMTDIAWKNDILIATHPNGVELIDSTTWEVFDSIPTTSADAQPVVELTLDTTAFALRTNVGSLEIWERYSFPVPPSNLSAEHVVFKNSSVLIHAVLRIG